MITTLSEAKKHGGNAIQVLGQHYLTHPAKDPGLYSKLISSPEKVGMGVGKWVKIWWGNFSREKVF